MSEPSALSQALGFVAMFAVIAVLTLAIRVAQRRRR